MGREHERSRPFSFWCQVKRSMKRRDNSRLHVTRHAALQSGPDLTERSLSKIQVQLPATAPAFACIAAKDEGCPSKRKARRRTERFVRSGYGSTSQSNFHRPRASLRSRVSKTQPARGGTEAACQIAHRKS